MERLGGLKQNVALLKQAAEELGYKVTSYQSPSIKDEYFTVSTGEFKTLSFLGVVPETLSVMKKRLADNKEYIKDTCRRNGGLNVADGLRIHLKDADYMKYADEIVEYFKDKTDLLVIKPNSGSRGIGVHTDIKVSRPDIYGALRWSTSPDVLVEEQIPHTDYRLFIIKRGYRSQVIHVVNRTPAFVIGDGFSTLNELITDANKKRLENDYLWDKLIPPPIKGGENIPYPMEFVKVNNMANISQGGENHALELFEVDEEIKNAACTAHSLSGLLYSAVDIMKGTDGKVYVGEVNALPGFAIHHFPVSGEPCNVAKHIIETCLHYKYATR